MNDKVKEQESQEPQKQEEPQGSSEPSAVSSVVSSVPPPDIESVPQSTSAPQEAVQRSSWFSPWLIVAVLALGLAGWQWMETRARLIETQQELASRLTESDGTVKQGQALAQQSKEQLDAMQTKLNELENKLAESKSQQDTLENLYQSLIARHTEEAALIDIEQRVTLASEQLQLAGNVQGAVLALQAAEARLVDSDLPQFIGLRKVLARDLERLRALPQMDLPGMYLRLENVIASIDLLPLVIDGRFQRKAETPAMPSNQPIPEAWSLDYWRLLAADFWKEMKGLVRIQRLDHNELVLLAPEQAFFLRENLKLRLLNARLALLSRDQSTYRSELYQAQEWLTRYFDNQEKTVQSSQESLKQLSSMEINSELPNLNESLSAIKSYRADKEQDREQER